MLELKHICKLYDRRVALCLIPFYQDRIDYLQTQLDKTDIQATKEREMMKKTLDETKKERDVEKESLNKVANNIYTLWNKIKEIRKENGFNFTNADLKVHRGESGDDVLFNLEQRSNLVQEEYQSQVDAYKNKTLAKTVYCRLLFDGVEVATTDSKNLSYPGFEVDIFEQFKIHVFTLPGKIQLEVLIDGSAVDLIDLIVPGNHVKSLTSASRLIKEYEFSARQHHIDKKVKEGDYLLTKEEKSLGADEKKRYEAELASLQGQDIDGSIFVKAEWEGTGENLPPARSETLFQLTQNRKNRHVTTDDLLNGDSTIDVNDPRYEDMLKNMHAARNNYLQDLLKKDAQF